MDLVTANLITGISPDRYQTGVATNTPISVSFLRDMDPTTFTDATIALEVVGTVLRIPCTYSYSNRILTITPTASLDPSTGYLVTIVGDNNPNTDVFTGHIGGILDILGNGMLGNFNWSFQTSDTASPGTPILISPSIGSAVGNQPTFQWTSVPVGTAGGTMLYQIEVSQSNTYENIYWPTQTDVINQAATIVQPARIFAGNIEYWWRVRALAPAGTGTMPGDWSYSSNFYLGDPTLGMVTPDDKPLGLIPPTPGIVVVTDASPSPGTSNLVEYPTELFVKLQGAVDLSQIGPHSLCISGQAVDGSWDPNAFKPIFSPSLNGSIYGSGGITVPGPEDSYQQILVSGPLKGTIAEGYFDGTYTHLKLSVPQSYFQDNNLYTITLKLNELPQSLQWTFTSRWSPVFASSKDIRATTQYFMPELVDDDIWYKIRRNSLYAIMIQVYVPTQIDGWSWIYRPPLSFNPNNPPFFAREYVRLKTIEDFLRAKLFNLLGTGRTQLGDFTVDKESSSLKQNLEYAINQIEDELMPFEDKLHGHTNRGYARGSWGRRGEAQVESNPFRSWPFGVSKRGPSFNR